MVKSMYKTAADVIGETATAKEVKRKNKKLGIGISNQGGETYRVPDEGLTRLVRFLILGSETGSFYASPEKLTAENTKAVRATFDAMPEAVGELIRVSKNGLAPKLEPVLFALALATRSANPDTRQAAYAAIPTVCGTASQLYQFLNFRFALGGLNAGKPIKNAKDGAVYGNHASSAGLRRALTAWINARSNENLAYQAMKYPQREGVSLRDVLRISRSTKTDDPGRDALYRYIVKGELKPELDMEIHERLSAAQTVGSDGMKVDAVANLIREYNLPREVVRTDLLNEVEVWEALLQDMPMTAMLRNIGVMESKGVLKSLENRKLVIDRLTDQERIHKSRLHPINIFTALSVYQSGAGRLGSKTWDVNPRMLDALSEAFDLSFANVTPSNKKILLAIDISSSMTAMAHQASMASALELSGVMALIIVRSEPDVTVIGIDDKIRQLAISGRQRPDDVKAYMQRNIGGATNLHLPFMRVEQDKQGDNTDAIVLFTDSENGAYGGYHYGYNAQMRTPKSLREYQEDFVKNRPDRRMVLCQMIANHRGWVHPSGYEWDAVGRQSLEIVGFDPTIGKMTSDFLSGQF